MYQVRNREYHPTMGRWVTWDPIGILGGPNGFEYGEGRPASSWDPYGLKVGDLACCSEWGKYWKLQGYSSLENCTVWKFEEKNPISSRVIKGGLSWSISSIVGAASRLFNSPGLGRGGSILSFGYGLNEAIKAMTDFIEAYDTCNSELCKKLVSPVKTEKPRAWYNPARLWDGPTYICLECPKGTDEVKEPAPGEWVQRKATD